jgi:signal transduction histidine kinase
MISEIIRTFERGFTIMRTNSKVFLVGILIFVFPLLFISLTQGFFTTAYNNIQTADSKRLGAIHKSVSLIVKSEFADPDEINSLLKELVEDNKQDFVALRIISDKDNAYTIINANDETVIGTEQVFNQHVLNSGFTEERNFNRFDFVINGHRVWQAYTELNLGDRKLYIFSEQDFSVIDGIMSARRNQAYFGLTAIFLFLIALAYWINKQTSWEKTSEYLSTELKERGIFSSMIAHEFRTPLTAIKGYAGFLSESTNLSSEEIRFTKNISNSAERLIFLVNDFLEVARLQSGKLTFEKTEFDLAKLIARVAEDLAPLTKECGVSLVLDNGPEKVLVYSDEKRLIQILTNIITNSLKFTKKGSVSVCQTSKRDRVVITIKDTGAGISSEDQKNLFKPFTRLGDADRANITGSGLGMWISSQLATLLGGKIEVESIKGVGTHTILTLYKNR